MTVIFGDTAEGWEPVADAFREGFDRHGELGAGCSVYAQGKLVVDLWGGTADRRSGRQWSEDTVAVTFSSTKGAVAICAHLLVQRGLLDLDEYVGHYWPEYGVNGKEKTTVSSPRPSSGPSED